MGKTKSEMVKPSTVLPEFHEVESHLGLPQKPGWEVCLWLMADFLECLSTGQSEYRQFYTMGSVGWGWRRHRWRSKQSLC